MWSLKNGHCHRSAIRAAFVALALGCLSLGASAAGSEFDAWRDLATGAGKHTVSFGSNGTPIISSGVPGPTAAGNMNFSHSPGGLPGMGGTAQVPSPVSGKTVPFGVKQPLSAGAVAGALGRFARKTMPILATGAALYDLCIELGCKASNEDPNSPPQFQQLADGCYTGPCYEYRVSPAAWSTSLSSACLLYIAIPGAQGGPSSTGSSQYHSTYNSVTNTGGALGYGVCRWNVVQNSNGATVTVNEAAFNRQNRTPDTPAWLPMTVDQFEQLVAGRGGWADGSAVDRALADAANAGVTPAVDPAVKPQITSPAGQNVVQALPKVTTSSDGSTVTEQFTCDWIVVPGEIDYRCGTTTTTSTPPKTTTETVVKTNPDGSTVTEVITKTTPGGTVTTSTTGEQTPPRNDCADGSTRAGCAELDTPTGTIPKSTKTITYTAETPFGEGSCPADVTANIGTLGGSSFKVWDWQKTCALSLPLRALIVSLATFAAFLILMPGKVET